MKTVLIIVVLFFSTLLLQSISPSTSESKLLADTTAINPNGSSELSMLMREMQQYTNNAKKALKESAKPAAFPESFDKIYTAKISEGMSKSEFYKQFADLYINAVKNYSKSSAEERIDTYNNMVSSCLACHSQHCPGPVPVIKKMVWEPNETIKK